MKIILFTSLFAVVLIGVVCANTAVDQVSTACIAEAKITLQEVKDYFNGTKGPRPSTSANMKCYMKCFMDKMGYMSNGVYDWAKAQKDWRDIPELSQFDPVDQQAFPKCQNEKGPDDCETAFKIVKCLQEFKA